jgi:hypothetical protein
MYKQWEEESWRIEHADDAKITFTIALHGKHAWEMLLEDGRRYHSLSHGWATDDPHDWEDTIAPVLRQFFLKGRLGAPRLHGNLCPKYSGREHSAVDPSATKAVPCRLESAGIP